MGRDLRTADVEAEPVEEGGSLRLCAATRAVRSPDDLIRFVAGPDGVVVPDVARKLPGRGVWVTADRASVVAAVKSKAFARSLKRQVTAAPELPDMVDRLLVRRTLDALSLANKAGLVSFGFDQVDALLQAGRAIALVQGSDAAEGGRDKLERKFKAISAAKGQTATVVDAFSIAEISLAMGRANVVHAGLVEGGATTRFLNEAGRVQRYRSGFEAGGDPSGQMRGGQC